ncbi:hypothetical protein Mal4_22940 [Maioricimonas rarisocia]|uniref:Uncharacterized protein n=1 Tax=Maioricimonas rarisocia TaxID=2528026 RepID=A0A517Z683_9PLAN|nr:hypothetical protein [Maioricimonas rarisocia]QDU37975.1 hypothetical protein Mal4_22940 [Maioricimonas rarisocia]
MTAEFTDAFALSLALGPALCLIAFVPLWADDYLFSTVPSETTQARRCIHAGDAAGLLPAALLVAAISHFQFASTSFSGYRIAGVAAALLLSTMLWVRSVQFAHAHGLHSTLQRVTVVGWLYPATMLAASYAVMSALMILSCLIKFEVSAIPYIAVAAIFLLMSSLAWAGCHYQWRRLLDGEA